MMSESKDSPEEPLKNASTEEGKMKDLNHEPKPGALYALIVLTIINGLNFCDRYIPSSAHLQPVQPNLGSFVGLCFSLSIHTIFI